MAAETPLYDLTLLLDLEAEEAARTRALGDTRASIEAHGELVRDDDWGERPLAYPIDRRKSADYHLLQFRTEDRDLLSGLERTLHITDGVLRFRLIKLRPGTPEPVDMRASASAAPSTRRPGEDDRERPPRRRESAPPPAVSDAAQSPDGVAEEAQGAEPQGAEAQAVEPQGAEPQGAEPQAAEAEPATSEQPAS